MKLAILEFWLKRKEANGREWTVILIVDSVEELDMPYSYLFFRKVKNDEHSAAKLLKLSYLSLACVNVIIYIGTSNN